MSYNCVNFNVIKGKNNILEFQTSTDKKLKKIFDQQMFEGQQARVFIETKNKKGPNNNQLARIHACTKQLALEVGQSFEKMKNDIKEHAGINIHYINEYQTNSFADCTSDEIQLVIQSIKEIGEMLNVNCNYILGLK